jgi:drug/metabolite transporter (DMT)-like permease
VRRLRRHRLAEEAPLTRTDVPWLAGAILFGGIVGPLLLMSGLREVPASAASLLLNLEGLFTALLAWFVFRENVDRRVALGMGLIVAGGVALSWQGRGVAPLPYGSLLVAGACLSWAIDNNLTQKVAGGDPMLIASAKGLVAGFVNLALGILLGARLPAPGIWAAAMAVGLLGYGVSLVLFVLALRHLGTARTSAYFSLAPFIGASASLALLREPAGPLFLAAGALMAAGAWLHVTERHEHSHTHERLGHAHRHIHDEHHDHAHDPGVDARQPHTHWHVHEPVTHSHPHYPDIHHRHAH